MESNSKPAGIVLKASLWAAQLVVAGMFIMAAVTKLTTPRDALARMLPWTGEVHPAFVTFTGIVDGLGGIGILLPALTRIRPDLTVLAAKGCFLLQVCAFGFHVVRGEALMVGPLNVVLGALSAFVVWGRSGRAAISAR